MRRGWGIIAEEAEKAKGGSIKGCIEWQPQKQNEGYCTLSGSQLGILVRITWGTLSNFKRW